MRECAGRRAAGSDDGRPVLINSQLFHPRHSAPRRSGGGRWGSGGEEGDAGREGGRGTAAAAASTHRCHPLLLLLPLLHPSAFDLPPRAAAAAVRARRPQMASPPCREHTTGTVSSHRRTRVPEKEERKKNRKGWGGGWGWGLVIAAVLQSQQWVLTDKSCAEDTRSRAFAQLPLLDMGLAYQGHWVRIDLVIKISPTTSKSEMRS